MGMGMGMGMAQAMASTGEDASMDPHPYSSRRRGFASIVNTLRFITSHPLTRHRPMDALARFLLWQVKSRLRKYSTVDWIAGSKLVVCRGMHGATGNIYCGLHEFADMAFLLHLLRPDDLFIDVGANIGSYTVLSAKVCGAACIAIEPDPGSLKALERNLEVNEIRNLVQIKVTAVGARIGTARFSVNRGTMNQVLDGPGDGDLGRDVHLTTIDSLVGVQNPIMMKLDVEGYEAEALLGASSVLANQSLIAVQTETADNLVKTLLEQAGFEKFYYSPFDREICMEQEGKATQGNNHLYLRDRDECRRRVERAQRHKIMGRYV